jgi:hypothetical protein
MSQPAIRQVAGAPRKNFWNTGASTGQLKPEPYELPRAVADLRGRSRAGSQRAQPCSVPPRVRVAVASESAPVRIEHVAHGVSRRAARREVSRGAESVICSRIATRPRWMGQGVTRCRGHSSAARYRVLIVHPLVCSAYPMAADNCHELLYRHAHDATALIRTGMAGPGSRTRPPATGGTPGGDRIVCRRPALFQCLIRTGTGTSDPPTHDCAMPNKSLTRSTLSLAGWVFPTRLGAMGGVERCLAGSLQPRVA